MSEKTKNILYGVIVVLVIVGFLAFRIYQDCQHPGGCLWDETPPGAECNYLEAGC